MGKNWVIAIGINEYESKAFPSLECAKNDAEKIADFCENVGFDGVFRFTESSKTTGNYLREFLEKTVKEAELGKGDNLWFFFAGHGLRYEDKDYLMFSDSNTDNGKIQETSVSVEFVTEKLCAFGADNVVLFLDACRNKPKIGGRGFGSNIEQGVITFYACDVHEQSFETYVLGHGLFTFALLAFFQEYSDGKTNSATVGNLYEYLKNKVANLNEEHGNNNKQTPTLHVEPKYKNGFNLLNPQGIPLEIIEVVKKEAYSQEEERNFDQAEEKWQYIDSASRGLSIDAKVGLERIAKEKEKIAKEKEIGRRNFLIYSFGAIGSLFTVFLFRNKTPPQIPPVPEPPIPPFPEPTIPPIPEPIIPPVSEPHTKPIKFETFKFETVTVNKTGTIINRNPNNQAKFFQENLGNDITLQMVEIPAGSFVMGSPESEKDRYEDEGPQHKVNLPAFYMGKFAVTQEQYQQIMGKNPSRFEGLKLPVERVLWDDAVEFCIKLSAKTGRKYRLPSEAEWEYGCRAGTTTPFHFGETMTTDLANYFGNYFSYASEPKGQNRYKTTNIGGFPPNAFGLYDMHGNVWEWCEDDWHSDYINAPKDGRSWMKRGETNKMRRGGSWDEVPWYCRSANRDSHSSRNGAIGFRVVCSGAART
jgi:formylglycine-generating enzyme required for sulfatase activity